MRAPARTLGKRARLEDRITILSSCLTQVLQFFVSSCPRRPHTQLSTFSYFSISHFPAEIFTLWDPSISLCFSQVRYFHSGQMTKFSFRPVWNSSRASCGSSSSPLSSPTVSAACSSPSDSSQSVTASETNKEEKIMISPQRQCLHNPLPHHASCSHTK